MRAGWMPWAIIAVIVVFLAQGVAIFVLLAQQRELSARLAHSLLDLDTLREAQKRNATAERPLVVNVTPAGASGSPVPVRVFIEPPKPVPAVPGEKPPPAPAPRLVAESPAVHCATKEECDRIYARAPQSITVDAQVNAGTLVTVCPQALAADGRCAVATQSLPLAQPVAFQARFVLAERGVFQGLNVIGGPVSITQVRTETSIAPEPQPKPQLPYHLAFVVRG